MNSEHAFATFRIAGPRLIPEEVTKILALRPDLHYAKGEKYRRRAGRPGLTGKTGLWYYSSDKLLQDDLPLEDHVNFLLKAILSHRDALRDLIKKTSSRAVLTIFWNGPDGAKKPSVPDFVRESLQTIPVEIESDFDTDEVPPDAKRAILRGRR
jgi:hypothetical protein